MRRVILIGDSIRMGYQETVRQQLRGVAEVWGPDQNGGDSHNVLEHLDEWALSRPAEVIQLNCGLHDIKKPFDTGRAQVPLDEYRDNLRGIFSRLREGFAGHLVWATTTPVDEDLHHRNKGFDRFAADVAAYNAASLALAAEFGLLVNDLYSAMAEAGPAAHLSPDGVHFTAAGSELLGAAVAAFLRPLLSGPAPG
jgi:lysophospholipase L1-like esterase